MKLTDLNRFGGIGANGHLVEIGGARILVDCGLHPKKSGRDATPDLGFLREHPVDAVVVTHCHLDHLGALPLVLRDHPKAPALLSHPSMQLAERLLRNSVNVMKRAREEKGITDYPLYSIGEVQAAAARFAPMLFGQPRRIPGTTDDVEITFFPAGHVPGAAGVQLVHKHRAIFFTGDVQFDEQLLVGGAQFPQRHFDTLVTETTRGATERPDGQDRAGEVNRLVHSINQTIEHGGSVLIPVFALGRMQEILLVLHAARAAKALASVPIFCAGLGMDLCDYMDEITQKTGLAKFRRSVLKDLAVKPPARNAVPGREPKDQGIYVLSSGMMVENTPSYLFASCLVGQPHNAVCFVGYCDPETPGGRMLATPKGETFVFDALNFQTTVRARIERFEMTGHADREELLQYALQCDPRAIVLTHGDPPARAWFEEALAEQAPKTTVLNPVPLRTYEV